MQVLVIASEKYYKCLSPFMHLWEKYAGLNLGIPVYDQIELTVCGFGPVEFYNDYKPQVSFYSVGNYADWPANRWSEQLLKILDEVAQEQFILMLEDYWLVRPVDMFGVKMLFDYAKQFENVLKIDLTFDRLYINAGSNFLFGKCTYDNCGYLDLIKSPPGTPYQMSLWGGIWNREQLRKVLVPGETPQEIEIAGTSRVTDDMLVLGTRQAPMLHANIYQSRHNGKPVYSDVGWRLKESDIEYLKNKGWIE